MESGKFSGERQYLDLLADVYKNGVDTNDRTGTGTRSLFGKQMEIDLRQGFPLLTTKRLPFGVMTHELLWMVQGGHNLQYLAQNNVNIWNEWPFVAYLKDLNIKQPPQGSDEWDILMMDFLDKIKTDDAFAEKYGELGPIYGKQWRHVESSDGEIIDQLANAQDYLRNDPTSRRIVVNSWNVRELKDMQQAGLPPCHALYQFYSDGEHLDLMMTQRSADMFLGVPFNMGQYALLASMMAQSTGHKARYFIHSLGNTHIYKNHFKQVEEQLKREPRDIPKLTLNPEVKDIFDFKFNDITIEGYNPDSTIRGDVAI